MKFKNILLLYKRSAYKIYFTESESSLSKKQNALVKKEIGRFKAAHDEHYEALRSVAKTLLTHGVRFTEAYRGRSVEYNNYDFVITVGGDGTFLEAARHLKNQTLIGINSAPNHSVGRFCIADVYNFEKILKKLFAGKLIPAQYQRLRLKHSGQPGHFDALNDILISHHNPAMLSRYYIKVRGVCEEQRSSGIWVSTPAGSSGASKSAGGKVLPPYAKKFQYVPRELYQGKHARYRLLGGVLSATEQLQVTSLMRKANVFCDGGHLRLPFDYSEQVKISISPHPLCTFSAHKTK